MVLGVGRVGERRFLLAGVDWPAMKILRPWWKWTGGVPGENGVLVGSEAARLLSLAPGGRLTVGGRVLTVTGVLAPTGSQDDQLVFAGLATAQQVLGKPGRVSLVEVAALCNACPVDDMVLQIRRVLPGTRVMAISQVVKGRMAALGHFRRLSYGISIVVALVCGLLVLVTMMGGVRERTAEIGVFRAIGFRRGHVARLVMIEAALLSLVAGALGYAAGSLAARVAAPLLSGAREAAVAVNGDLAGLAVGLAVLLGLGGSLYPALMAARLDPSEALRAL
jgi:putative ABC transport system permease protein